MAAGSITHSTPTRPQTRPTAAPHAPRATPETVAAYFAAGHSTAEAVEHFGVSDSYLRRLKRNAKSVPIGSLDPMGSTMRTLPCVEDRPSSVVTRHARIYDSPRLVYHAAVARGHELWWCARCNDYMHPLPGTTGKTWNMHGCYLHAAEPEPVPEPRPATAPVVPEPEPRLSVSQSQRNAEPVHVPPMTAQTVPLVPELPTYHKVPSTADARTLSAYATAAGPDVWTPDPHVPPIEPIPDPNPSPEMEPRQPPSPGRLPQGVGEPEPADYAPRREPRTILSAPIIVRQIVRVPVEARRGGLVEWLNDRPGLRNQLLAVVVFLVLVVLTWIG